MSSDLANRLRSTYHVADLPADNPIRLASDALDAARSQVEAAHKRAADAERERDQLAAFARDILADFPEYFPDGFDINDLAIKHGLLIGTTVTEPCSDDGGCQCANYHGSDGMGDGVECFRRAPILRIDAHLGDGNGSS